MSSPLPPPQADPLEALSKLASGNSHLVNNPGLLTALQKGNATPEQAQAINQFNVGLDAQRQVRIAQVAGTKINLSPTQQSLLGAMGQSYAGVLLDNDAVLNAGGTTDGKPKYDKNGNIVTGTTPAAEKDSVGGGWFDSWGSFAHHLTHNVATNAIGESGTFVTASAADALHSFYGAGNSLAQGPTVNGNGTLGASVTTKHEQLVSEQQSQQMIAQGYDPKNPMSVAAYKGTGKDHSDTTDLAEKWTTDNGGLFGWDGNQAVIEAMKFNDDPTEYLKQLAADPNLTPDEKAQRVQSEAFGNLALEVQGRQASVGHDFARGIGLDPVANPKAYNYTAVGVDTVASFLTDPTILVGKGYQIAKVASVGIDDLNDGTKIAKILDTTSRNPFHKNVQRGWQSLLDDGKQIREGLAAGTDEGKQQAAAAFAHARSATPHIADLLPDINGTSQLVDKAAKLTTSAKPLETLDDVSDYLQSKNALLRLTRGKAAVETGLMPGAVSPLSFRLLKGAVAGKLAEASVKGNQKRNAINLIAHEDDAVDLITGLPKYTDEGLNDLLDGNLPAAPPEGGGQLASAQRAEKAAAAKGDALLNLRSGIGPKAIGARARLMGQRMANFLPRNNTIKLGDADGAEKVYRFGQLYLNKGDSALYGAMFANGDEGVQKAVLDGILEQTAHAAGLGRTVQGREEIERLKSIAQDHQYGHTGNETIVDPVTGGIRDVALFPTQVRDTFHLPSFKSLNDHAARVGMYESTIGRALNSQASDTAMSYFRMAMLLKPNIATRNIVEGQAHVAVRGRYLEMLRVKSVLGDSGALTSRKATMQKIIDSTGLDRVQRTYHSLLQRGMSDEEIDLIKSFDPEEFRATVEGFGEQIPGASPDPTGFEDVDKITRAGMRTQRLTRSGFGLEDTGGLVGADRYVHALAMRLGQHPDLDRALIEAAENPSHGIEGVIEALNDKALQPVVQKMIRANTYEDPTTGITRVARTDAEKAAAVRKMAELQVADIRYLLSDQAGNHIKPIADYIFEHGRVPGPKWVEENLTDELRPKAVLAPQFRAIVPNGVQGFAQAILDSTGVAYKALVDDPIKRTTTDPVYMMNYVTHRLQLKGVEKDIAGALLDPKVAALNERHNFALIEHELKTHRSDDAKDLDRMMIDSDHEAEMDDAISGAHSAAAKTVHDLAVKRAYNSTEAMIDDPGLKTQADVVGRGLFMFPRAMQAFIRRWGGLAIEDPTKFRKLFLAMEGVHNAGLTYTDTNGQEAFMYPGSDLMMGAFSHLANLIPGLGHGAMYPISGGVGGQTNMLAPGVENPLRFSMSPMLNMPFHLVEKVVPEKQQEFDAVDRALNGQDSQGKSWFSELVPGAISKFTTAGNTDPRNSALASAMSGAVANLVAADPDGAKGIWLKPDATSSEIDSFMTRLQTQVRNQLYLRAAFGEFSPAPPGIPEETNGASKADPLFRAAGIQNLSDEYKFLLNQYGGDRGQASVAFIGDHPERAVYTVPGSQSTTNKAYLPSTTTAEHFVEKNLGFMEQYKHIAAYFVPQDTGTFDLHAYRAQIETGLREKKTPQEVYSEFRVSQAETEYYANMDKRDAAVDAALSSGNKQLATNIRSGFTAWSKDFYVANPLFKQKMDQYNGPLQDAATNAVAELGDLTKDPNPPADIAKSMPGLRDMIGAYHSHEAWTADHKGATAQDTAVRAGEAAAYHGFMLDAASQDPNLKSIYNGVFRILDSKLAYADATNTGG